MKICVMIPAYNESESIATIIQRIQALKEYDIEVLVINDGSTDETASIAEKAGAIVVNHPKNRGLGKTFKTGLIAALEQDADFIINIDADGQYAPEDIPLLIEAAITHKADLVMGTRFEKMEYPMPKIKRFGNKFMTRLLSWLIKANISDAQTGFRVFSRRFAETLRIVLKGRYTYTQETIIHAKFQEFKIEEVAIPFYSRSHGKSRLIQSVMSYFVNAIRIISSTYRYYKPFQFFAVIAAIMTGLGCVFLSLDQVGYLDGLHVIPSINISNDPKILWTIGLPFLLAILFFIFGWILDSINRTRLQTIKTNLRLQREIEMLRNEIAELSGSKHK